MRFFLATGVLYLVGILSGPADPAPSSSADRVYVLGEVRNPGAVNLTESKTTMVDAIAQCGGFTEQANAGNVRLIRHLPGLKSQIFIVNLFPYLHGSEKAANPEAQSGDVINVDQLVTTK